MTQPAVPFSSIDEAIAAIAAGKPVIVVDDEHRENEGDLIIAAELATAETIAFMVRYTSGVICAPLTGERLDELAIPMMVAVNSESMRTAYTVSVDHREGTTTGISASDRARTLRALVDPMAKANDFNRPGHIFPLRASPGGVLRRAGHTEAAVDLARMAGLFPGGVLCEIVNEDGTMARLPELVAFAQAHSLHLISIADLIRYRKEREKLVRRISSARIPTDFGEFTAYDFRSELDGTEHLALVRGDVADGEPVLVRVHSECLTGDVFGSLRCDCGTQLRLAMREINAAGRGVVVYLRGHEGRGIGLAHKLRAYNLQDQGRDTVEANIELGFAPDLREYGIGAQILTDLGVQKMRLLTNNPAKLAALSGYELEIVDRVPLVSPPTEQNTAYLRAKQDKLGHMLEMT